MSSDLHRDLAIKDTKGYKENGCKIRMMELMLEGWSRWQPVLMHLHKGGLLQKLLGVRAYASVLPSEGRVAQ